MTKIIYIENEIKDHKRTELICNKFKNPEIIIINRFSEVFNKKNQSFRFQKANPALIIAKKYNNLLHKTPANYGIGNECNYYFSYMYNCIFDCKYCFLQGLYSSANHVIFVNYEDFYKEIKNISNNNKQKNITIFSGYDCDSLAFESVSNFMSYLIKKISKHKNIELEIRTKSTYTKSFSKYIINNIIIAYSFTPEKFSSKYELGVPSVNKRLGVLQKLSNLGWKLGIRFDPVVVYEGWQDDYKKLFVQIFKNVDIKNIHSISFGKLRFPVSVYKKIIKENSSESLFFNLVKTKNIYESNVSENIEFFCKETLKNFIDEKKIFFNN
ncbi:MAG: DNA photolyase [Pelagibacterales bacterium]|nr:DNA photolyase [Pelagibacterales bacterium]OUU61385.1 MAG: hypothetical protein CBC22_07585 [Alphaproteobacteria bacterium TMED62]|tara:strand:+ start:1932 stop:2909 length:978 start_codon:yes stop_codon:yes gene_type:complete